MALLLLFPALMQKDRLVIDIETKNTFAEVGGQDKVRDLEASLIGVYSYNQDKFFNVLEGNFHELAPLIRSSGLIIGFSINRFDLPVMEKYFDFDLYSIPCVDLLEVVEERAGHRISLDLLAKENLKIGKTGHGLDAIKYYAEGNWDALEKYCTMDVKITRDLYEFVKKHKHFMIPQRFGLPKRIDLELDEPDLRFQNTLF